MSDLLIGCGSNRDKRLWLERHEWSNLVTLDNNPSHKPDFLHDLTQLPLPFKDASFDEIHAYEVLEHTGQQGDYRWFFAQWTEFWRIMKPNGLFMATVPHWRSPWAWGDPSHTRVIQAESLMFLDQDNYYQVGKTAMSDFRYIYKVSLKTEMARANGGTFEFILRKHVT